MTSISSKIADNFCRIAERIQTVCQRSGRDPASVRLVAVTKYAKLEWIKALLAVGVHDCGESRPQQLCERLPQLPERINWHLIGHLQSNKVRSVLPVATIIHSVDTLKLLTRIDRLADECRLVPRVLVQVNVSSEATKHGFAPEALESVWDSILEFKHVQVDGLMTMAPRSARPDEARPVFAVLRKLRIRLLERSPESITLPHLSMGMSGDFEAAVEEEATLVRIGSGLFQGLQDR